MTLAVPRIKSFLTPFPASTLKALKFGVKAPALPFRLDVHVLLWKGEQLIAHEYLLGVSPQQCGHHLDELSATYEPESIYDYAGRLEAAGLQVPILSTKAWQRFETIEQWRQREPETVQALLQPAQLYWEDLAEEDGSLWAA